MHDRCCRCQHGLPGRRAVGGELDVDTLATDRVGGADGNRLAEHRRDPERVDRARRMHGATVDRDAVRRWPAGEGVGDDDLPVSVDVNEILGDELCPQLLEVEVESARFGRGFRRCRPAVANEAAQDPEVERALRDGEAGGARATDARGRDPGRRERIGDRAS